MLCSTCSHNINECAMLCNYDTSLGIEFGNIIVMVMANLKTGRSAWKFMTVFVVFAYHAGCIQCLLNL